MAIKSKTIPIKRKEAQEREFRSRWENVDYTERKIGEWLPEGILEEIKYLAIKRDIPYEPLMRVLLADAMEQSGSVN